MDALHEYVQRYLTTLKHHLAFCTHAQAEHSRLRAARTEAPTGRRRAPKDGAESSSDEGKQTGAEGGEGGGAAQASSASSSSTHGAAPQEPSSQQQPRAPHIERACVFLAAFYERAEYVLGRRVQDHARSGFFMKGPGGRRRWQWKATDHSGGGASKQSKMRRLGWRPLVACRRLQSCGRHNSCRPRIPAFLLLLRTSPQPTPRGAP